MLTHTMRILGCGKMLGLPRMPLYGSPWAPLVQRNLTASQHPSHWMMKPQVPHRSSTLGNLQHIRTNFLSSHYGCEHLSYLPHSFMTSGSKGGFPEKMPSGLSTSLAVGAHFHSSPSHHQSSDDMEPKSPSKLAEWWQRHTSELRTAPMPALVLGFSGLVPFMVPALYSIATASCGPNVAFAQVAYGACILSFLGGVRWGNAVSPDGAPTWPALCFSVLPSLIAWTGLMMPLQPGLACVILGLLFAGVVDSRFRPYPAWFRSLRFLLTTFAVLSISVTFAFSILFPPPEPEHGYNIRKLIKIAQIIVQD